MSKVREHFSSRVGFMFAAVGSAIGLGVLWKFPYIVGKNGGGLFLLCYLVSIIFIAIPVFIGELMMGRTTASACVQSFQKLSLRYSPLVLGGYLGLFSSFLIMSFYSVIAGWGISYIWMSLMDSFDPLTTPMEIKNQFTLLTKSPDICLLWHFVFTAVTTVIVFSGVRKGIEKWSRYMTQSLLVILFAIVLYNTSLNGFSKAVEFIFYPDFTHFHFSSLLEAVGLAFFTMSLGQGIMFSYGSYLHKETDLLKTAIIVGSSVIVVSLLAALSIFPVVFSFGFEPNAGPGLVFETLPFLFKKLIGGKVIATAFFILFVFTAITSAIAFIEVVSSNFMELFKVAKKKAVLIAAATTFLLGIPSAFAFSDTLFPAWSNVYGMNFLDTIDYLVSTWLIPIGGLLTSLFLGWEMQRENKQAEFDITTALRFHIYNLWRFLLRWIIPFSIIAIIFGKVYRL